MSVFEDIHSTRITGSLAMFDRLIFRGHLTQFYKPNAARVFLWSQGVPLTAFGTWAKGAADALCEHAHRIADEVSMFHATPPYSTTCPTPRSNFFYSTS